jgi:hypothetical protein
VQRVVVALGDADLGGELPVISPHAVCRQIINASNVYSNVAGANGSGCTSRIAFFGGYCPWNQLDPFTRITLALLIGTWKGYGL